MIILTRHNKKPHTITRKSNVFKNKRLVIRKSIKRKNNYDVIGS